MPTEHIQKTFRIGSMKDFIPMGVDPWIFILFVIVIQISNVVYLPSAGNMYGGLSLLREDVMMCFYASFAGMNVAFPMLWRFKFSFTTRSILTIALGTLAACNILATLTTSLPLLVALCFVGGFVKMWAMFECLSTLNPWIAPNFDFPRFFPILYMMILGSIYVSSIIDTYLTYYTGWTEMHLLVAGLLCAVLLFVRTCMKDFFPMGKGPLLAFDFPGLLLWGLLMMLMSFVALYGEHYGWMDSGEMRLAVGMMLVTAGLCFGRMYNIRHPYIKWDALAYKRVPVALLLFFVTDAIMETPNCLQNILTGSLLGFDTMNTVGFNWFGLLGTIAGCLFSLWWMWSRRFPVMRLAFFGMACAVIYQVFMYFLTSTTTSLEDFYLPTFLRTFGYAAVYCALTYYLKEQVPFDHFLQVLAIVGVVRSGIGGTVGEALYGYGLRWSVAKNSAMLSSGTDIASWQQSHGELYSQLMQQVMAVSIKELWGITIMVCILLFAIMLLFDSPAVAAMRRRGRKTPNL